MKMYYGNTPIKSLNVKHYEVSTNDCTAVPSDLQAGITCVSKGKKITGTGKTFEFARYGKFYTNVAATIPNVVNIIEIMSLDYPVQASISLSDMLNTDFTISQTIGHIAIDGTSYPITVLVSDGKITFSCDKTIKLQIFYGKDNYICV